MYDVSVIGGLSQVSMLNLGPQGTSAIIEIDGGSIHLTDVGHRKLGPSTEVWGVCIVFCDRVWTFRYENGQGKLNIEYNPSSKELTLTSTNGTITELTS